MADSETIGCGLKVTAAVTDCPLKLAVIGTTVLVVTGTVAMVKPIPV